MSKDEKEESKVININGTDYKEDQLDDKQKYLTFQIKDLQQKANQLRFQLDQVQAGANLFTNELIKSLEEPEAEVVDE